MQLKYEPMDLDDVELPENHPFFVKKTLTEEEEALIEARVKLRRGAPIKDLSDPRLQQNLENLKKEGRNGGEAAGEGGKA